MNEVLAELKAIYHQYQPLWEHWTQSSECKLPNDVVQYINAQLNSKLIVTTNNLMFYNKLPVLTAITDTLKTDYIAYQKWVITRFVSSLVFRGTHSDGHVFFSTEVAKLHISFPLKKRLEKFGLPDVRSIIQLTQRQAIKKPELFNLVVEAQAMLVREERAAQARKERKVANN